MKKIIVVAFIIFITSNAFAQELPSLPEVRNLKKLNSLQKPVSKPDPGATKTKLWSFSINPYFWTIAIGGTFSLPNIPNTYPQTYDFQKSFGDALDNLKFAFMIGGRVKYKKVSLFYDLTYANLKDFGATLPSGAGLASANSTFKELITDLSIGYEFYKGKSTFLDVYGGARFWTLESELTLIPTNPNIAQVMTSSEKSWVDPIVGINSRFILGKQWFSYIHTDFGGFGANSSWEFMFMGGFGYDFNPNWNTTLGAKYLGLDYDKDGTRWNVNHYGLTLSFGYRY